jgi:hypothetical protein
MERPSSWKILTLGAALTGLSVTGAGAAQSDTGSSDITPASVSAAPLFDDLRLLASGSGNNFGSGGGDWVDWGGPNWWNPGGCISASGPFGNVSGSFCV